MGCSEWLVMMQFREGPEIIAAAGCAWRIAIKPDFSWDFAMPYRPIGCQRIGWSGDGFNEDKACHTSLSRRLLLKGMAAALQKLVRLPLWRPFRTIAPHTRSAILQRSSDSHRDHPLGRSLNEQLHANVDEFCQFPGLSFTHGSLAMEYLGSDSFGPEDLP